jgi:hypothetical protein
MSRLSEIFVNTVFDEARNEGFAGAGSDERGKLGEEQLILPCLAAWHTVCGNLSDYF